MTPTIPVIPKPSLPKLITAMSSPPKIKKPGLSVQTTQSFAIGPASSSQPQTNGFSIGGMTITKSNSTVIPGIQKFPALPPKKLIDLTSPNLALFKNKVTPQSPKKVIHTRWSQPDTKANGG